MWPPLGRLDTGAGFEAPSGHPSSGGTLSHPRSIGETEGPLARGPIRIASEIGQPAGSRFLIVANCIDRLDDHRVITLRDNMQIAWFEEARGGLSGPLARKSVDKLPTPCSNYLHIFCIR